ncbi:DUF916 and DUF3324 domain-containing protein [Listeria costaricensis]|uniref:DUF916 and DUF3324 domain-containing protein n=1 Tax=Listeria costaricensis TaxID=2026604 RepID=UPI000C0870FB|nr:DUF916 and DUF3324 domain-containing protein [Listeria costaricensis]
MRFTVKFFIALGLLFTGLNLLPQMASADSTINFGVEAEIPDNQIDKKQSYFDLKMSPGQEQTVYVNVSNATSNKVTVEMNINAATTNDNGYVDYSEGDKKPDASMKNNITDMVEYDKEIEVQPGETKKVPIKITMPDESYDGIVLGGINFTQKESEVAGDEESSKDESMVKNRYSYVIGLMLTETDTAVEPDMELKSIKPGQYNYANYVKVNLQNPTSAMITGLNIDAKVYKDGSDEVLHETKKEGLSMAPNSNFNYMIDWENQEFKPGTYRMKMTATDGNDHTWKWDEKFTIERDDAKKYNDRAVGLEKDYTWLYITLGIVGLLILLLIVFLLGRRSSKKKENRLKEQMKQELENKDNDPKE